MHSRFVRLMVLAFSILAASVMTATAGTVPLQELTPTASSPVTPTPTGPPPHRDNLRPTEIQPGRIYEGNLSGVPVEFLLDAELGQFMVVELTSADFDAVLEISDSGGAQVAYDDDTGAGNLPQITFIAPSTGTFTVKLRAYSDSQEGSYILSVTAAVEDLRMGEATQTEFDGMSSVIYSFRADAGDVVNIVADSGDTVDTILRLIGPDGAAIGYVDDYTGVDPEFRRQPLNADGRYYLIHAPYSESAAGLVTLSVEKTELVMVGLDPAYYEIAHGKDLFNVEVGAGQLYLVTLTANSAVYGALELTDGQGLNMASVTFTAVEGASLMFRAGTDDQHRLSVTISTSSEAGTGVYLSIRPINQ